VTSNFPAGIQYYEDNTTNNGTNYWYALVTVDWVGNYNESIISNSLNATANDTIAPELPTSVAAHTSSGINTLVWTNVTSDVGNNYDLVRYTVWYWRNTSGIWNSTSWKWINTTIATVLAANISGNSTTHSVTDFPSNNSVRYYYFVTTIDDGNNENVTYNTANSVLTTVSAPSCSDGAISSTGCMCGGTFYKSGYCCSNVFSTSSCSASTNGGGGGGGGAGAVSTAYSASHMWATVLSGALTSMNIDNTNIAFTKLQFISSYTISDVEIKVTALTSQPTDITKVPEDTLYQYLDVDTKNLPSAQISSTLIYFRIPKTWINSNNIDYKTMKLNRYEAGSWNRLITTYLSSDSTHYKYSAATPGFSYFAITGIKEGEVEEEAPANVTAVGVTNVTEVTGAGEGEVAAPGGSRAWLGWLIVILIIGGTVLGVYFYQKRKEQQPSYGFEKKEESPNNKKLFK
jgi:PGF-pre-PGF domain-containing protein